MSFKNLSVATKLASVFALMILVILGMGASSYIGQARLQSSMKSTERGHDILRTVDAVRFRLSRQENSLRGLLISGDDYYRKRIVEAHRPAYERHVAELEKLIAGDPKGKEQIARLKSSFRQWTDGAINPAIALAANPETRAKAGEMIKNDGIADKLIAPVEETADEIAADANERIAEEARRQADIAFWSTVILLAGIALVVLVALAAALLLRATIATPVLAMTTAMRRLAAGDNAVDIPALGRHDEIGAMAAAVGVFRDQALAKIALEGEAEQARADAERTRTMSDAERREHEAAQAMVVETLATHLSRLADGDLTCTIESDFRGRYAKLRNDFNTAVGRLEEAMASIAAASSGVSANADAIANASDDLSRRTEHQAASLEETAAAMDEITATVRRTAAGAKEAERLVAEARGCANRSGEVVDQAVSAMAAIENSSRQIAQIIGVIDEIAFQTNLLALNAGVEAARAGEAGRGFAVVASEVRALAQRSAEAAKEIKALITASSEQVGTGVKSVGQAGESLKAIVAQVAEIDSLIAGIASSAVEQSTGLNEINSAVNNMDATVQQNAAMVEEATSATHALKAESSELARMVARFRVGGRNQKATLPPASAGATVTMLKTSSQVAARPERDAWEEF